MDSITQIVLGAAVGEAVAGRQMGAKAALWGAVAATLPDLDVFLRAFYHPFDAALVHRGFSHSLLFALLAGPFFGWLFNRFYKNRFGQRKWILLWTLAIVTHPMLDMFTNYGTQFFWPFSPRITFNSVFVVDPLYTIPFATLLLMALFTKRDKSKRSRLNWAGIIWSCGYLLWGIVVKLIILDQAPAYFRSANIQVNRTMVTPMPLTSFYWEMIGEDEHNYYIGYKSLFAEFKPEDTETIPKHHHLLNGIRWEGMNRTQQLKYITNGYYALEQHSDTLYCYDLRFGTTKPLTAGRLERPLMGYGLLVDKGVVQKSFQLMPGEAFKAVNFGRYLEKVFGE